MSLPEWRVFADPEELAAALADAVCSEADRTIRARGTFHLVLAGGSTPLALYRALAQRNAGDARWHIWYGDERCLPSDHPERNSHMVETAWLGASAIAAANRHAIPAERGAEVAAADYAVALATVPLFDLVLLGMGEDGHTASLFPGQEWGDAPASPPVLPVHHAPKPPPERVSLSAARLSDSRRVWFVITGAGKRAALARWKRGEAVPAAAIRGREETLAWLDQAASGASGAG